MNTSTYLAHIKESLWKPLIITAQEFEFEKIETTA